MKIACLISGFLRTFQNNLDKLMEIFSKYDVDYFLHISNDEIKDDYINKKFNLKLILEKLKPVQVIYESDPSFDNIAMSNIKIMWYKFTILNYLKNNYSKIHVIKYDLVFRIRPDILILDNEINLINTIPKNTIFGDNDEFFYGTEKTINKMSELYYNFDDMLDVKKKGDFFFKFISQNNIKLEKLNINYKLVLTQVNIIAIAGDSGSGKTTLMNYLDKIFKNSTLKLEGDRYHKWERGDNNWNSYTHLNPEANHICKFKEDVFNLKIGSNIYQVDYDHKNGKFTEKKEIKSSNNIIMCGLHTLLDRNTNKLFNLKIFLDTDKKLKYYWKIIRDINERGYLKEKVIESIMKRETDNIKFIQPQENNSDIIINFFTDDNFDHTINVNPNIYLSLTVKNNILDFIESLYEFNIEFQVKKKSNNITIVFNKIQDEFIKIYNKYVSNKNPDKINYYILIISFIVYYQRLI